DGGGGGWGRNRRATAALGGEDWVGSPAGLGGAGVGRQRFSNLLRALQSAAGRNRCPLDQAQRDDLLRGVGNPDDPLLSGGSPRVVQPALGEGARGRAQATRCSFCRGMVRRVALRRHSGGRCLVGFHATAKTWPLQNFGKIRTALGVERQTR